MNSEHQNSAASPAAGHQERLDVERRLEREREFHDHAFSEGTRAQASKFYRVIRACRQGFEAHLQPRHAGATALEYGCGPGRYSTYLAERYASVVGIDISGVAIQQAREDAEQKGFRNLEFHVMDAEALQFGADQFDLICGVAILHHLDLAKAFTELSRTLKPSGTAVFMEPLGHNPAINWYRRATPHLRTPDEHPLLVPDLRLAERYFSSVEHHYYTLSSLLAVPFAGRRGFSTLLSSLDAADRLMFGAVPPLRKYAWQVVTVLRSPIKAGG